MPRVRAVAGASGWVAPDLSYVLGGVPLFPDGGVKDIVPDLGSVPDIRVANLCDLSMPWASNSLIRVGDSPEQR